VLIPLARLLVSKKKFIAGEVVLVSRENQRPLSTSRIALHIPCCAYSTLQSCPFYISWFNWTSLLAVLMMFNSCRRGPASITRVFRATTSTARIPSTRPSSLSLSFQTPARPLEARWLHVSAQFRNQAAAERRLDEDRVGKAPPQFREINKFQQLIEHNMVHPNVVEEITRGMGHHTMTEVQTLTINQGLQGTDM
jgi:hypothetical protein